MVKKIVKGAGDGAGKERAAAPNPGLADSVKESAQQIWLAGLGAFSKAQAEGGKVFEALVKQGIDLQRKTQSAAEGKFSEASERMTSMANEISSKASGQWDRLETIFEDRVAKALNKLGVPSARDIAELTAKLDALNARVQKLGAASVKTGVAAKSAAKVPASKVRRKSA